MSEHKKLDLEVLKYALEGDGVKSKEAINDALSARIVTLAKEKFA